MKPILAFHVFFILFLFRFICPTHAQGNIIITQSFSSNLMFCSDTGLFNVWIKNTGSSVIDSVNFTVVMPPGLSLVSSSVDGSGFLLSDNSIPGRPQFILDSIVQTDDSTALSFRVQIDCEAARYYNQGGVFKDTVLVVYPTGVPVFTSNPLPLKVPHIVITSVVNGNFQGHIGNIFFRRIIMQNSGTAPVNFVSLLDMFGDSVAVLSVNTGAFDNSIPGRVKIDLGTGNFPGGVLNVGDTFSITETVTILGCTGNSVELGTSHFRSGWGCSFADTCETSPGSATVSVPNLVPVLNVLYGSDSLNVCYGPDNVNTFREKWYLTGGPLRNGSFKCSPYGRGYAYDELSRLYSSIIPNSFEIRDKNQNLVNYLVTEVAKFSSQPYPWHSCTGQDSLIDYILFKIPWMDLTDTFYVSWQFKVCCPAAYETCTPPANAVHPMGPGSTIPKFYNECLNDSVSRVIRTQIAPSVNGDGYWGNWQVESEMPLDIDDDTNFDVNFRILGANSFNQLSWTYHPDSGFIRLEFLISPCFRPRYNDPNQIEWRNAYGVLWNFQRANFDQLTHIWQIDFYQRTAVGSWDVSLGEYNSQITLHLQADCQYPGCSLGTSSVFLNTYRIPDSRCNICKVPEFCSEASGDMHCPGCITPGIHTVNWQISRENYGLPDNDDNHVPDNSGVLNMSLVKTKNAVFGDTIAGYLATQIHLNNAYMPFPEPITNSTNDAFRYGYDNIAVSNGFMLSAVSVEITLTDANGSHLGTDTIYHCIIPGNAVTKTTTGLNAEFHFDFSPQTLKSYGNNLPAGFVKYEDNDAIYFIPRFRVSLNVGVYVKYNCIFQNKIFLGVKPYPTIEPSIGCGYDAVAGRFLCDSMTQFYCTRYSGEMKVSGFTSVIVPSISGTCPGSAGVYSSFTFGLPFPYEYRQFGFNPEMFCKVLKDFDYSGSVNVFGIQYDSNGGYHYTFSYPNIPTAMPADSIIRFNFDSLFTVNHLSLPDEGYGFYFSFNITPTCRLFESGDWPVFTGSNEHYVYQFYTRGGGIIDYPPRLALPDLSVNDISYPGASEVFGPTFNITPLNPTVTGVSPTVSWDIEISNPSQYGAGENSWLSGYSSSGGIRIQSIREIAPNIFLPQQNGVFRIGTFGVNVSSRRFQITATYNPCVPNDSLMMHLGWNCPGFPDSLGSFPCTTLKTKLIVNPVFGLLQTHLIAQPSTVVDLCDTLHYAAYLKCTQGTLYGSQLKIALPDGMSYAKGTISLAIPATTLPLPAPAHIGGNQFIWYADSVISYLAQNGLPLNDSVIINLSLLTDCDFIPGTNPEVTGNARNNCNPTAVFPLPVDPVYIFGVPQSATSAVSLETTSFLPCINTTSIRLSYINISDYPTDNSSSIRLSLVPGLSYNSGSTLLIHNSTINTEPFFNGNVLEWQIPAGILPGDSVVFTISISRDDAFCGPFLISTHGRTGYIANCISSGNCTIHTVSDPVEISLHVEAIPASFSIPDSICIQNQLLLTATSGSCFTYAWDFGDGTQSQAASPSHTYNHSGDFILSNTVSSGCLSSTHAESLHVSNCCQNFGATALSVNSACSGEPVQVNVSASGGSLPYSGTGTFAENYGSYSYTVTDANGCIATASISLVTTPASLMPSGILTSATEYCLNNCGNFSVPVVLTVQGGSLASGANWVWYSGSCGGTLVGSGSTIGVTPSAPTTYYVRAENGGCFTDCITVAITIR